MVYGWACLGIILFSILVSCWSALRDRTYWKYHLKIQINSLFSAGVLIWSMSMVLFSIVGVSAYKDWCGSKLDAELLNSFGWVITGVVPVFGFFTIAYLVWTVMRRYKKDIWVLTEDERIKDRERSEKLKKWARSHGFSFLVNRVSKKSV